MQHFLAETVFLTLNLQNGKIVDEGKTKCVMKTDRNVCVCPGGMNIDQTICAPTGKRFYKCFLIMFSLIIFLAAFGA
jgi:hypothetical protein